MKNVNLTSLYLNLIAKYNITTFNVSSVKRIDSQEPTDVMIRCHVIDMAIVNQEDVQAILNESITGEVKQANVKLSEDKIQLYVEFLGNETNPWDK